MDLLGSQMQFVIKAIFLKGPCIHINLIDKKKKKKTKIKIYSSYQHAQFTNP